MASRKSRKQLDASIKAKASGKSDIAEWAKALLDARNCGDDPVPEGFLTLRQISDQLELARSTAHTLVEEMVEDGRVEVKEFYRGRGKDGRRYKAKHYRIIK